MTGEQLQKTMETIQFAEPNKYFYPFSGAKINFDKANRKIRSFKFNDGSELDKNKNYKIASREYMLYTMGDDMAVLKEQNISSNIEFKGDLVTEIMNWLKNKDIIKVQDHYDSKNLRLIDLDDVEIANYDYPKKGTVPDNEIVIPIFATSDMHGNAISDNKPSDADPQYKQGGGELLVSFYKIMKSEWTNLLWFDCGDIFQGAYESKVTEGKVMSTILKYVNAASLGNHEFDYGKDYLMDKIKNYPFVSSDVYQPGKTFSENEAEDESTKLLEGLKYTTTLEPVEGIKIGVIGLITSDTPSSTGGDLSYVNIIINCEIILFIVYLSYLSSKYLFIIGISTSYLVITILSNIVLSNILLYCP